MVINVVANTLVPRMILFGLLEQADFCPAGANSLFNWHLVGMEEERVRFLLYTTCRVSHTQERLSSA